MADQLQSIVQRMIDAGESEDNIATVIQHFKAQQPEPTTLIGAKSRITSDTTDASPSEKPTLGEYLTQGFVDNPLIQGAAHPQTLGDFTSLLLPQMPLSAARGAIRTGVKGAIRVGAAIGDEVNPKIIGMISPKWGNRIRYAQEARDAMNKAAETAPTVARSTDSTARVLEPIADAAPVDLSAPHLDRSTPMRPSDMTERQFGERLEYGHGQPASTAHLRTTSLRDRFPNGLPRGVDGVIEPVPSHAPTTAVSPEMVPVGEEAAYNAAHAEAPPAQAETPLLPKDQILRDMRDPELVQRAKEMQERAQAAPRLQRERMDVGAEKVGRAQGMTTDDVRAQAGPVLGEARGEASPVFPQGPFDRMAETLKALKPEDRLAYVMRAGDVKTQAQLETIRRVMAKYGLVIPAAVSIEPSVREMLLQRMRAGVTGEQ